MVDMRTPSESHELLELLVHRVLAQHETGEVCTDCPEWSVLVIAYGQAELEEARNG